MQHLNQNYKASKVVSSLTIQGSDNLVGTLVKFHPKAGQGKQRQLCTFKVGGRQKVWGYDSNGNYASIDGYRLFAIDDVFTDDFGVAATAADFYVVASQN